MRLVPFLIENETHSNLGRSRWRMYGGGGSFYIQTGDTRQKSFFFNQISTANKRLFSFVLIFFSISSEGCGFARPRNQFDLFYITSLFPSCLDFRIGAGQKRPSILFFFCHYFLVPPPPHCLSLQTRNTQQCTTISLFSFAPFGRPSVRPSDTSRNLRWFFIPPRTLHTLPLPFCSPFPIQKISASFPFYFIYLFIYFMFSSIPFSSLDLGSRKNRGGVCI